ncbi:MAG: endonuclease III [Nitrospirae bacterium]|nr:endonuclease III [Candidatus Manganitrophaceae bacterium]
MKKRPDQKAERRQRAEEIIAELKTLFPQAKIVLNFSNHWELFVSVVLSAQCTDKMVNQVTATLFKKYKTLDDYVNADPELFEQDIRQTGFYRNKAKSVLGAARLLKERFGGTLPRTMEEMRTLPGAGRKTANVVLGNAYNIVEGIAVDTHVKRLTRRWKLTRESDPEKIERDLMELIPKEEWFRFTYLVIEYGRKYCTARPHPHEACPLSRFG